MLESRGACLLSKAKKTGGKRTSYVSCQFKANIPCSVNGGLHGDLVAFTEELQATEGFPDFFPDE